MAQAILFGLGKEPSWLFWYTDMCAAAADIPKNGFAKRISRQERKISQ